LDDLFINQWMLDEGYAVEYNGGTKSTAWSEII
jgi:endonuclease YncB( thermonuclease family)